MGEDQEHQHDDRVSSVGFHVRGEVDQSRLNDWIGWILREKGADIYRTKGILAVQGMKDKFVFQAVHMAFSGAPQKPWADGEERECKLTFIGKNLDRQELVDGFMEGLVKGGHGLLLVSRPPVVAGRVLPSRVFSSRP